MFIGTPCTKGFTVDSKNCKISQCFSRPLSNYTLNVKEEYKLYFFDVLKQLVTC